MAAEAPSFLAQALLSFALSFLVLGLIGAYFGKGKSRSLAFVIMLLSGLLMGVFAALTWPLIPGLDPVFNVDQVIQGVVTVGAATLGSILAILVFVQIVVRS